MLALFVGMWGGCSAMPQEEAAHEDHEQGHETTNMGMATNTRDVCRGVGMQVECATRSATRLPRRTLTRRTAHCTTWDILLEDLPKLAEKHDRCGQGKRSNRHR